MEQVIIGVDPHKLSATIEVVDQQETVLGTGRFTTDQAGYAAMRTHAKTWSDRVWAVEGANGAGRPLAQRLLEAGEHVVDVPHADPLVTTGSRPAWLPERSSISAVRGPLARRRRPARDRRHGRRFRGWCHERRLGRRCSSSQLSPPPRPCPV